MDRYDVERALRGLIASGELAVGARLPSCRDLAGRLGSNPNTVSRALHTLQHEGLVRTVPRRGAFVAALGDPEALTGWLAREAEELVARAIAAGIPTTAVATAVATAVTSATAPRRRVSFVACNPGDLVEFGDAVERAVGTSLGRVLLAEVGRPGVLDGVDAVVVPLFHVGDVLPLLPPGVGIVDVSIVPDPAPLLELTSLGPDRAVVVASRSPRTLESLASRVREHFRGRVGTRLVGADPADLSNVDVLVHSNGAGITDAEASTATRAIRLTSMLESRSAASLRSRLARWEAVATERAAADLAAEVLARGALASAGHP